MRVNILMKNSHRLNVRYNYCRNYFKCTQLNFFGMMSIFTLLSFYLQVRNKAADLCLDTRYKGQNERFDIQPCVKDGKGGGEQVSHVWDENSCDFTTYLTRIQGIQFRVLILG